MKPIFVGALIALAAVSFLSAHQLETGELSSPTRTTLDSQRGETNSSRTTILVTGDVLPARTVNVKMREKNDFTWPYSLVAEKLRAADFTFINLETPLIDNCPSTHSGMIFCGDVRSVEGLLFAGVDVASVANNHALNQGTKGFTSTAELLNASGIDAVGTQNQPVVKEKNGVRFAFLAYNDVGPVDEQMASAVDETVEREILAAKEKSDVVIVQFHWGEEYRRQPTERQRTLAHLAVDAGADVVVGNHPHWYQSTEKYKDGFIAYSHGNFVFDQMWSIETRQGIVGEYVFQGSQLVDVIFHPIQIEEYGQPRWLEGEDKEKVLRDITDL